MGGGRSRFSDLSNPSAGHLAIGGGYAGETPGRRTVAAVLRAAADQKAILLALCLSLLTGCADNSGCSGFSPSSQPMKTDDQEVEVQVDRGALGTIDVNGGYYVLDDPDLNDQVSPTVPAPSGTRSASVRSAGEQFSLVLDGVEYPLSGPIGCD